MSWVKGHVSRSQNQYMLSSMGQASKDSRYSYKRFFTSVLICLGAGALFYTAIPYAAAFTPVDKIVGTSEFQQVSVGKPPTQMQKFSRVFTKRMRYKRVYLRKGQHLNAYYSMPAGAQLTLHVRRCTERPIIEIFSCKPVGDIDIPITSPIDGLYKLQASHPGIYYFSETVLLPDKDVGDRHENYEIIWRR